MSDVVGRADYVLGARLDKLERDLDEARRTIKGTGEEAERAFGQQATAAADKAGRAIADVDRRSGSLVTRFKDLTKGGGLPGALLGGIGIGAGISAVNLVGGVMGGAMDSIARGIGLASDRAEAASKANVLFGASYGTIERASRSAAGTVGMASGAYLAAAGDLGNLLGAFDITGDAAADMSTRMIQLAADVGSFNNASPTEVVEALGAAFRGETEPARRFGIVLDAASVSAKAVELGLAGSAREVSKSARAQATYALVLEQTAKAQGDFARTADGKANADRINAARTDEALTRLGETVLPLAQELMPLLADGTIAAIDAFTGLAGAVAALVDGALSVIANSIDAIATAYSDLQDLLDPAGTEWDRVTASIREQAEALGLNGDAAVAYAERLKLLQAAEERRAAIAEQIADIDASTLKLNQDAFDSREQLRAQIESLTAQEADAADIALLRNEIDRVNIRLQADLAPLMADRANLTGELEQATAGLTGATSEDARISGIASQALQDYNDHLQDLARVQEAATILYGRAAGASDDAATALLRLAHAGKTVPRQIERDLSPLAGVVKGTLKEARQEVRAGMADLVWALNHPLEGEKLERFYRKQLRSAYAKLHEAQATGNTFAIAKAEALVAGIRGKLSELESVRISIETTLNRRAENRASLTGGFQYRAAGGPLEAGRAYVYGERGPELGIFPANGTMLSAPATARLNQVLSTMTDPRLLSMPSYSIAPASVAPAGIGGPQVLSGHQVVDLNLRIDPASAAALRGAGYDEARVAAVVSQEVGALLRAADRGAGARYSEPRRY
jgi:hypothetical protein